MRVCPCFVHPIHKKLSLSLSTKDLDTLLNRLVLLGVRVGGAAAKDELGVELPAGGDLPGVGDLLVDEGAVVLEVGAEALGLEGGPEEVLLDAVALVGPDGELVGVEGKLLLHAVDDVLVVEEEDGSRGALEHGELVGRALPLVLGDDTLEDVAGQVPQLVVLAAKEHNEAVGLRVERRGSLQRRLLDELLDAGRANGELLGEGVVGAAVLGQLEESVCGSLGSHFVVVRRKKV